jgi:hypothetical protein
LKNIKKGELNLALEWLTLANEKEKLEAVIFFLIFVFF